MEEVRRNHLRSGLGEVKEMSVRGVTIIFSTSAGGRTNVSALRMSCGFQLLVCAATGCAIAASARSGALSVDRLGRKDVVMRSSGARRGGAGARAAERRAVGAGARYSNHIEYVAEGQMLRLARRPTCSRGDRMFTRRRGENATEAWGEGG